MTEFKIFKRQLARESLLQWREKRLLVNTCLFFFMMLVFFPLALPSDLHMLRQILPGIVWIALLLAAFLSVERLFQQDQEDGVIEQWLISSYPLVIFIAPKLLIHWLFVLVPILFFCLLSALLFSLSGFEVGIVLLSLICGTPTLFCLCALSAAFSSGIKQKGIFMALVLMPLSIPILIFGSATITAAMASLEVTGHLALLLAMSIVASTILPFAIASVIRMVSESGG